MLSVVIPAYNEEKTIRVILNKVLDVDIEKEVIVINDGSTDSTRKIVEEYYSERVKLINKENGGKASAVRSGIENAKGDYVIIQDADLEYDPENYPELIEPLLNGQAEAVYGDRFPLGRKNMFFKQIIANKFLTFLTNFLFKGSIRDMETCYKVIPLGLLRTLDLKEENFDIEAEISAKLLKRNVNIVNVPIRYKGRSYEEGKKIGIKDAFSAICVLLKYKYSKNNYNIKL
ncbi:glycosyltransferase family 2 protein [Elusimicrobiota bacterium]